MNFNNLLKNNDNKSDVKNILSKASSLSSILKNKEVSDISSLSPEVSSLIDKVKTKGYGDQKTNLDIVDKILSISDKDTLTKIVNLINTKSDKLSNIKQGLFKQSDDKETKFNI